MLATDVTILFQS